MALTLLELEYITPPDVGSIFAVPIGTVDQALDLWKWASEQNTFSCTLTARLDGSEWIQVEGVTAATVTSVIGGDRWIVYDSGEFKLFDTSTEALTVYKVKGT